MAPRRPSLCRSVPGFAARPVSNLVSIGSVRLVADAPALRSSATRPIGQPGTARPIQASSRTAGYLSVTCDPGTAHASLYIHRRCSPWQPALQDTAALQETVAAAAVMRHRIYRRAATSVWEKDFRSHVCESLVGNPSPHIGRGGSQGECPCPESVPHDGWQAMRRLG